MAQPLQNITITAPAFKGLNTQDSPLSGDAQYASIADNVVIDSYGRIGARKGLEALTDPSDLSKLSGDTLNFIHESEAADGTVRIIGYGNGDLFSMGTSGTELTKKADVAVGDEDGWAVTNFNDKTYLFHEELTTRVYDPSTDTFSLITAEPSASTFQPQSSVVLAAFGRMWATDTNNANIVYWSDLLSAQNWEGGSSGSLDLDKVWADGADRITALASWNGYLVIFGYNSVVLYQGAESPATMSLADTIGGVGCIARDSLQATGNDLLFLSSRGLMALGRTIQEKSNPLNDVSKNIHNELTALIIAEQGTIKSVYSGSEGFYLLLLPLSNIIYCFDTKGLLENGAYRVTRWLTSDMKCFCNRQDDRLLIGNAYGVNEYRNYRDNGETYTVRYYSNPLSFGDPSHIKFVKKIVPTVIGGKETINVKWSYDFGTGYKTQAFLPRINPNIGYYGASEYNNTAEYVAGNNDITVKRINATGSGNLVTIGIESNINGAPLSLQEFNIQAIIGRTY